MKNVLFCIILLLFSESCVSDKTSSSLRKRSLKIPTEEDAAFWARIISMNSSVGPSPTVPVAPSAPPTTTPVALPAPSKNPSAPTAASPIAPAPTSPTTVVDADFTDASIDNFVTLTSFDADEVAVTVENQEEATVFVVQETGDIGSTCPPSGGSMVPLTATTVTIPFNGVDTTVVICRGGFVIGVCYHVFDSSFVGGGSSSSDFEFSADFSGASSSSPVSLSFTYGPGVGLGSSGAAFLIGGAWFVGGGGSFFTFSGGSLAVGDPCPPDGAILLPPYPGFPFSLFALDSAEDEVVYACDGNVIGICEFEYVQSPVEVPSGPPVAVPTTPLPSTAPSTSAPSESSSPTTSFPTVSRETLNQVITCISVIDESCGSQSLSRNQAFWATFRQDYPERPFCLLQPPRTNPGECADLFIPQAFSNDTNTIFSNVTRDQGVDSARSDWFDICNLDGLKAQGITDVAIFVDNSGSLTTAGVQASYDFLMERMTSEGLTLVAGIENTAENWIGPFLTDFM